MNSIFDRNPNISFSNLLILQTSGFMQQNALVSQGKEMLKSTYKPSGNAPPPLPAGWTEHKAPTGHTYYYNAATKESTYTRPGAVGIAPAPVPPVPPVPSAAAPTHDAHASFNQYRAIPQLSDPATANAFLAQYNQQPQTQQQQQQQQQRPTVGGGHHGNRPRPQPRDKPKSKVAIPDCEPWILVYTKYGRRFVYNPIKKASYWRIPEKVMKGILELDIQGIKEKAGGGDKIASSEPTPGPADAPQEALNEVDDGEDQLEKLGSDYEEVEVTDDSDAEAGDDDQGDDDQGDDDRPSKRQRTEEPAEDEPVEFNEDDIAYQLQAMGEEYGLDPGEYDDGNPEAWPEGAEGLPMSDSDARELFKDLLNDYAINPYSPWDKLIEEGKVIDDSRYTVLPNMKSRRDVWEEWSREKIQILKERRAKEEKKDPRIPYMAFLQEKATPKLYWPEFRRKFKKEAPLRDTSLSDKDREKWYREYMTRLKMPQDTLKKDLTALLKSVPAKHLNNKTMLESLPSQVLADVRYISLDSKTRDALIEAYISTLGPPPQQDEAEEDEAAHKAREARRRREKALEERERAVAEEKRRQQKRLAYGRAILREEERELEKAMHISKKGLQGQLLAAQERAPETGDEK